MKNGKDSFDLKTQNTANDCVDLFELLKRVVCCSYISDLKTEPYNAKARQILSYLNLDQYPPRQVNDLCKYLGISS